VEPQGYARERNTTLENLLDEDGYPEEEEEEMKITVDGSVVYLGPCETGVYVRMGNESQGDSPIPATSGEMLSRGVLVDYAEDGSTVGVEILVPQETEKRPP